MANVDGSLSNVSVEALSTVRPVSAMEAESFSTIIVVPVSTVIKPVPDVVVERLSAGTEEWVISASEPFSVMKPESGV